MKRLPVGLVACGAAVALMAVAAVVAAVVVVAAAPKARAVEVPFADDGYSSLGWQVIRSQAELDTYIATLDHEPEEDGNRRAIFPDEVRWGRWQQQAAFVKGLRESGVNFDREVLVVAGFNAPAGSDVTPTGRQTWADGEFVCRFRTRRPTTPNTPDAYHAAVYVVPSRAVSRVNVLLDDRHAGNVLVTIG